MRAGQESSGILCASVAVKTILALGVFLGTGSSAWGANGGRGAGHGTDCAASLRFSRLQTGLG
ncbi:hypothetical protein ACFP4H_14100 [Pseudophaeobacter arcticus]|uniref:hypothetical protein n=1 Tax=Pseudophaeobacter arcticus TaxID=385492 RepID=UPI00040141C3|nr:hypothetical protein [Pseudophaeobacter arcticus]